MSSTTSLGFGREPWRTTLAITRFNEGDAGALAWVADVDLDQVDLLGLLTVSGELRLRYAKDGLYSVYEGRARLTELRPLFPALKGSIVGANLGFEYVDPIGLRGWSLQGTATDLLLFDRFRVDGQISLSEWLDRGRVFTRVDAELDRFTFAGVPEPVDLFGVSVSLSFSDGLLQSWSLSAAGQQVRLFDLLSIQGDVDLSYEKTASNRDEYRGSAEVSGFRFGGEGASVEVGSARISELLLVDDPSVAGLEEGALQSWRLSVDEAQVNLFGALAVNGALDLTYSIEDGVDVYRGSLDGVSFRLPGASPDLVTGVSLADVEFRNGDLQQFSAAFDATGLPLFNSLAVDGDVRLAYRKLNGRDVYRGSVALAGFVIGGQGVETDLGAVQLADIEVVDQSLVGWTVSLEGPRTNLFGLLEVDGFLALSYESRLGLDFYRGSAQLEKFSFGPPEAQVSLERAALTDVLIVDDPLLAGLEAGALRNWSVAVEQARVNVFDLLEVNGSLSLSYERSSDGKDVV